MAGVKSSKTVFLYVLKILMERSDAEHPITTEEIISALNEYGYSCDRKSIYRYIDSLIEFGIDIVRCGHGYCVVSREFEIHELKLLADAVQSSRFITVKKSRELTKKLGTLASVYEAKTLSRSVHMIGVNKTDNERVFYTLDAVYEAIRTNKRVQFKYFRYNPDGTKQYRDNGAEYIVSPYAVVWDDEKYYLHAYNEKYDDISSFRLDLMEGAKVSSLPRLKQKEYASYNPNDRQKAAFSQFGGEETTVVCEFDNLLAGAVFDHFGTNIVTSSTPNGRFRVSLNVIVSQQFLSWMFGFGDKAKILAPQSVVNRFKEQLELVRGIYGQSDFPSNTTAE